MNKAVHIWSDWFGGQNRNRPVLPPFLPLLGVAFATALAVVCGNFLNANSGGQSSIWPANGVLLGILLLSERRRWLAYLSVSFLINLLGAPLVHSTLSVTARLSLWNLAEIAVAAYLLRSKIRRADDLVTPKILLRFFIACIVAPIFAGLLQVFFGPHPSGTPFFGTLITWLSDDATGLFLFTPLVLSLRLRALKAIFRPDARQRTLLLLALAIAVTCGIYTQSAYPLGFLIFPTLLFVVVGSGLAAGCLAFVMVEVLSFIFTAAGRGPILMMHTLAIPATTLNLEIFTITAICIVVPFGLALEQRKRLERQLRAQEATYLQLTRHTSDVIILGNLDGQHRYVSPSVVDALGWSAEEILSQHPLDIIHPEDHERFDEMLDKFKRQEPSDSFTFRWQKKDGSFTWFEASVRLMPDGIGGQPNEYIATLRDISERKATEDSLHASNRMLQELAMVDQLTGLANRRRLDDQMDSEWRRAVREHTPFSILMIDVDSFKAFNDMYGHMAGDECLKQIAQVVSRVPLRLTDLVARVGGEEFVALLPNTSLEGARTLADRILEDFRVANIPHAASPSGRVTVSIGLASEHASLESSSSAVLLAADKALYRAKAAGKNCLACAEPEYAAHASQ